MCTHTWPGTGMLRELKGSLSERGTLYGDMKELLPLTACLPRCTKTRKVSLSTSLKVNVYFTELSLS